LTQRLFGFELLMAPYTIAHLKLGLMLYPPSAPTPKPPPRLGIYLTNTLELPDEQIPMQLGPWRIISQEAADAVTVKRETPLLVIIGNPPYSANSANKSSGLKPSSARTTTRATTSRSRTRNCCWTTM
jgi:predicted helicase